MESIKNELYKAFPTIKTKEFRFLEMDYNELFGDMVPDYISKLKGIRVWEREDGYDIQEGARFEMGLSAEDTVKRIKRNYEQMVREAEIERREREAIKIHKEQKRKEKMLEQLGIKGNVSTDTLEFLTSLI